VTRLIHRTEWQSFIRTNILINVHICHLELTVQGDKALVGKAIYVSVCQRLSRTSLFIKQSDRVSLGQATSVN